MLACFLSLFFLEKKLVRKYSYLHPCRNIFKKYNNVLSHNGVVQAEYNVEQFLSALQCNIFQSSQSITIHNQREKICTAGELYFHEAFFSPLKPSHRIR